MAHYLPNLPPGPLDTYRSRASFDWKQMKLFLDSKEIIEFENLVYQELKNFPSLFEKKPETIDELRRTSTQKVFILKAINRKLFEKRHMNTKKGFAYNLIMYQIDPSVTLKLLLAFGMYRKTISLLGTEQHNDLVESSLNDEILGCFSLTEIAHGSNIKGLKTTATYDPTTKEFIMHTPKFQDAKCWSGALGQTATHAVVYADLVTPDGKKHGLHAFAINIRDPKTMQTYPNVVIGDMGKKLGLNGIDNGYMIFNHYRVPKESLLNRVGDVTEDGRYVTQFNDLGKRHGANLGILSHGRIYIISVSTAYLMKAITIAVRYAAVRKQFGENNKEELSILEYQSHQHRLLPYLALTYAFKIFGSHIYRIYEDYEELMMKDKTANLVEMGLEIHAISSASKPYCTWTVRDGIQECREACGGHGYLQVTGLGDLRNDHDPNLTYEGDGHVLIQQTGNWLLKFWPLILKGKKIQTPYKSVDFLNNAQEILMEKFSATSVKEIMDPKHILRTYRWLICYLLKTSSDKFKGLMNVASDSNLEDKMFFARNNSQVYFLKTLALVYIQHLIFQKMYEKIVETNCIKLREVLSKLLSLVGWWSLEKHLSILYSGNYITNSNVTTLVHECILTLCEDLKNDAVALVDAIAKPDFITNSPLGYSDGQVYKHLENAFIQENRVPARPNWWREILDWKQSLQNKL